MWNILRKIYFLCNIRRFEWLRWELWLQQELRLKGFSALMERHCQTAGVKTINSFFRYVILICLVFLLKCSLKCVTCVYCFYCAQSVPPAIILTNKRKWAAPYPADRAIAFNCLLERGFGDEENTGKYLSEGNSALRHNIHAETITAKHY